MAVSAGRALAGCALIAFIGVSAVRAATGRIAFSGAIVEPTCSGESVAIGPVSASFDGSVIARLSCGRTAADPGRVYSRTVTHPTAANLEHDRLLAYFASYAHAAGDGETTVKVVVNTYD
jgi:hypothetical protein